MRSNQISLSRHDNENEIKDRQKEGIGEKEVKTDVSLANGLEANVLKVLRGVDKVRIRSILIRDRDNEGQSLAHRLC